MIGVRVNGFLPPPIVRVALNGVLEEYSPPPPPTTIKMNGVRDDYLPRAPPTTANEWSTWGILTLDGAYNRRDEWSA